MKKSFEKEEALKLKEKRENTITEISENKLILEEKKKRNRKFYQNNESHGIKYDWKLIMKEYDKLHCPEDVYNIPWESVNKAKYFICLSPRSTGKTTNWMLLGMVMNKLYGTQIAYVRLSKDQITSGIIKESLFSVISKYENGRYIKFLTDNTYNSIFYSTQEHRAYYQYVDEYGNVLDRSNEAFCYMLSVDKNSDYKSGFNLPYGDFVLLDEFINTQMFVTSEHVINFLDLTKTIFRERQSPIIVMLANNIARSNVFFSELLITKQIQTIDYGKSEIITTSGGTKIYVEMTKDKKNEKVKKELNSLFYGFNNPRLASITGQGEVFAFDYVQHILSLENKLILDYKHYILTEGELLRLDICYDENFGNFIDVHRATKLYDDSVIYTIDDLDDKRYVYGIGKDTPFGKMIIKLIKQNKIYFSDNEVGYIFKNYIKTIKYIM